jgi:hypothetical protein
MPSLQLQGNWTNFGKALVAAWSTAWVLLGTIAVPGQRSQQIILIFVKAMLLLFQGGITDTLALFGRSVVKFINAGLDLLAGFGKGINDGAKVLKQIGQFVLD